MVVEWVEVVALQDEGCEPMMEVVYPYWLTRCLMRELVVGREEVVDLGNNVWEVEGTLDRRSSGADVEEVEVALDA